MIKDSYNPYKSKIIFLFSLIAVLLIIVSFLEMKNLTYGIEFKGGSLVTIDTEKNVDISKIKTEFLNKGYKELTITKAKTPFGYRIEIEIPNTEKIEKSERLKDQFYKAMKEWVKEIQNQKEQISKDLVKNITKEICSLASTNFNESNNPNDYEKQFLNAYKKIKQDYQSEMIGILKNYIEVKSFKIETISPSLSLNFIEQVKNIAIIAIILLVISVFLIFKNIGPSIAVIVGALSDIIIAIGGMALLKIPFTLASFAALLTLVGYSLDTDILLTTRILKNNGKFEDKAFSAMKTGLTMSTTDILSFLVLYATAYILKISIYYQIAAVVLVGSVGDIFATWGINALLLKYFSKR